MLTTYTYEQEAEMIAADQEAFELGLVYFQFDEAAGFWRRFAQ
jgi:hypothetical protein